MSRPRQRLVLFAIATTCLTAGGPGMDQDGDGLYSFEELNEEYPKLTKEMYIQLDLNEDSLVSPEEFRKGLDGNLLPRTTEEYGD